MASNGTVHGSSKSPIYVNFRRWLGNLSERMSGLRGFGVTTTAITITTTAIMPTATTTTATTITRMAMMITAAVPTVTNTANR